MANFLQIWILLLLWKQDDKLYTAIWIGTHVEIFFVTMLNTFYLYSGAQITSNHGIGKEY